MNYCLFTICTHTLLTEEIIRGTELRSYSWMDCRWRGSGATWRTAIRIRRMCRNLLARSYGVARLDTRGGEFNCKQSQRPMYYHRVESMSH